MKYEEYMSIRNMILRDLEQYQSELNAWYNHEEWIYDVLDWETVTYYERELIPKLNSDLENLEWYL